MDNYELENVNTEIETTESGVDGGWIALAVTAFLGLCSTIYFGVKYNKEKCLT
jgi:hypothetical protein